MAILYHRSLRTNQVMHSPLKTIGKLLRICCLLLLALAMQPRALAAGPKGGTQTPSDNSATVNQTGPTTQQAPGNPTNGSQQGSGSSAPIESQIEAYQGLDDRAVAIAQFLRQSHYTSFLVLDPTQYSAVPAYRAFLTEADSLSDSYCTALRPRTVKLPFLGGSFLSRIPTATQISAAAAAVTAAFAILKTNVTVTASSITVPDEALVAAVRGALGNNYIFYYPTEYPVGLGHDMPDIGALSLDDICPKDAKQPPARRETSAFAALTQLQYLDVLSTSAIAANPQPAKAAQKAVVDALTALNAAVSALTTSLTGIDPATNVSGWQTIDRGEQLWNVMKGDKDHPTAVVQLKVQAAGGELITRDRAYWIHGQQYHYSGGIVATVIVFDAKTGELRASQNFWRANGDRDIATFRNVVNPVRLGRSALNACIDDAASIPQLGDRKTQLLKCIGSH
jgi:hypothetical protein